MKIAVISLSNEGARIAARLANRWQVCEVFLHGSVTEMPQVRRFDRIAELAPEIFPLVEGLVFIAPAGVVVRAVAPCLRHKAVDPAVVVVDAGGRWAVSLLSGHEGGANELAMEVANILIGGLTGIPLADAPTDFHLHDTWFVVAHFHFTIMGGAVFGFFAAFHYWFPKMSGKKLNEALAKTQAALMFVGFNCLFIPLFWLGNHGMRRRVADYPAWMDPIQTFASVSSFVGASLVRAGS